MNDLTARIDEALRLTPEGAPGPWMVDYCGGGEYLISSEIGPVGRFTAASGEGDSDEAYAMGAAPDFRLLLVEARAQLAAQAEALVLVQAALTPSAETKAAYSGEFYVEIDYHNPEWDEESETSDEPEFLTDRVMVPWDVIKQIMATIGARTLLGAQS